MPQKPKIVLNCDDCGKTWTSRTQKTELVCVNNWFVHPVPGDLMPDFTCPHCQGWVYYVEDYEIAESWALRHRGTIAASLQQLADAVIALHDSKPQAYRGTKHKGGIKPEDCEICQSIANVIHVVWAHEPAIDKKLKEILPGKWARTRSKCEDCKRSYDPVRGDLDAIDDFFDRCIGERRFMPSGQCRQCEGLVFDAPANWVMEKNSRAIKHSVEHLIASAKRLHFGSEPLKNTCPLLVGAEHCDICEKIAICDQISTKL